MRRTILMSILTIVTIILILTLVKGIHIGKINVASFTEIREASSQLDSQISEANNNNDQYVKLQQDLAKQTKDMSTSKKEYLDLVTHSSDSQIREATQLKTYYIEYLWSQVGNHATADGVTIKMDPVDSADMNSSNNNITINSSDYGDQAVYKNLNFTVNGEYLAIVDFMHDLENDENLGFVVEDFHMEREADPQISNKEKATFIVKDVRVVYEAQSPDAAQKEQQQNNDNNNTTTNQTNNTTEASNTVSNNTTN